MKKRTGPQTCIIFLLTIVLLGLGGPAAAVITVPGRVLAIDDQSTITIALPPDLPTPAVGDEVELNRLMHGGFGTMKIATWKISEVDGALAKATLQELIDEIGPKVNEVVDMIVTETAGAEPVRQAEGGQSYAVVLQDRCEGNNPPACVELALMYKRGDRVEQDGRRAYHLLKKAADLGHAPAYYELDKLYRAKRFYEGLSFEASKEQADQWLRTAAEMGYAKAQNSLAYFMLNIDKDYEGARTWYRRAAKQGDAYAQKRLGNLLGRDQLDFFSGKMIWKADPKEAFTWYRLAAEQNEPSAQLEIASMYARGEGVVRNRELAIKWYRRAAANGSLAARDVLTRWGAETAGFQELIEEKDISALRGVHVAELTDEKRRQDGLSEYLNGVWVTEVKADSPARHKLLEGDIIRRINDYRITSVSDYRTLPNVELEGAESVTLDIYRLKFDSRVELPLNMTAGAKNGAGSPEQNQTMAPEAEEPVVPDSNTIDDEFGGL